MRSVLEWQMVFLGRRDCRHGSDPVRITTVDALSMKAARISYSHSMVPGGLLVMSSTTRLTSATSLVMRVEMRSSTS